MKHSTHHGRSNRKSPPPTLRERLDQAKKYAIEEHCYEVAAACRAAIDMLDGKPATGAGVYWHETTEWREPPSVTRGTDPAPRATQDDKLGWQTSASPLAQTSPKVERQAWKVVRDKGGCLLFETPGGCGMCGATVGAGMLGWTCVGFTFDDEKPDLSMLDDLDVDLPLRPVLPDGEPARWAIMVRATRGDKR